MRVETRSHASGEKYFSFVYWDGEKRIRLKQSEHPKFLTRDAAQEWAKAKEAEFDCAKARILRRLAWRTQYYEFSKIADSYIEHCKKVQPNSWANTAIYIDQYIFPFFLNLKKSNNPNNWSLFFDDFKNWLEAEALTIRHPQRLIAYSTKNHCIKTLNTFLAYLVKRNLLDPSNVYKVRGFDSHLINSRDSDDVISNVEFSEIYQHLLEANSTVAHFFQTAYYTGMRFNEIYGLSMDDLFIGELEDAVLKKALTDHGIEYYGYIVLESQPADKVRKRLKDGSVARKPLKGKRKISEKFNRVIPIIDKDLFNNLVALYKIQEKLFEQRKYGRDLKNYLLFDQMTGTEAAVTLRDAYAKTKFKPKSYHCCRHTRCTELVGQTRDFVLARYWLGHARQETTLRYTHIYQQSVRQVRKKKQRIDFLK
jgi:integrase